MTFFTFRKTAALLLALCISGTASLVWAQNFDVGLDKFKKKDYAGALKEWQPLANRGDVTAQAILGWIYLGGLGVKPDLTQAAVWLRKAADQGDAASQYRLGMLYDGGQGVKQDDAQAVAWYRKAAEQGFGLANYLLVGKYHKAAERGDADAQFNLGEMYAAGRGVLHDDAQGQARAWYRKAAEQGHKKAQDALMRMSERSSTPR